MIRRTVEISRAPCHLAARDEQLLVLRREERPRSLPAYPANLAGSIPFEDLGVLVVDERETTYSHTSLVKIAEYGGALVVCGRDHLPCGMYLPLSRNTELLGRLEAQLSVSKPTRKRLWAQLVAAKVRGQADNVAHAPAARTLLLNLSRSIRSGDPENVEAQAARVYWGALFADLPRAASFRREPGELGSRPPNNLLDYGYATVRAALARALVSAGLLPALGIKHISRANPFCLADDLIEPLRPLVDARVRSLAMAGRVSLDQPTKADLLRLLGVAIRVGDGAGPLEVAMTRYVASFVRCLTGESDRLQTPRWDAGRDGRNGDDASEI